MKIIMGVDSRSSQHKQLHCIVFIIETMRVLMTGLFLPSRRDNGVGQEIIPLGPFWLL